MSRDELLQAATSLKWREMAELPVVKQHHNHCLECHHWRASPMYVKHHMKSKHPELTAIVQDVTAKTVQSDLAGRMLFVLINFCLSGLLVLLCKVDLVLVAFKRSLCGKCETAFMANKLFRDYMDWHHPSFS